MAAPIKPVYKKWNSELGEWQWGLMPSDYMRVAAGYACGRCLEPFEFWVAKCPVCGLEQDDQVMISETPSEWRKQG